MHIAMGLKKNLIFIVILVFIARNGKCLSSTCSTNTFHMDDGVADRTLEGRIIKNSTVVVWHSECFLECAMDCRCLSFVVCGKQCTLNADQKEMRNNKLESKKGCTYYEFRQEQVS